MTYFFCSRPRVHREPMDSDAEQHGGRNKHEESRSALSDDFCQHRHRPFACRWECYANPIEVTHTREEDRSGPKTPLAGYLLKVSTEGLLAGISSNKSGIHPSRHVSSPNVPHRGHPG